jgi:glycolate dehydrogenase iron-sulfur subunit
MNSSNGQPGARAQPPQTSLSGQAGQPRPASPASRVSPVDPSGELRQLAGDCVHCGFCLPACPTYQLWGEEMDSPRGRIHLITQMLNGSQASAVAAAHIDRCLGCMACVPACPSGVRYDRLIEAARSWTEEPPAGAPPPGPLPARSLRDRAVRAAIFRTFPYPRRLRLLTAPLRAAQRTGLDRLLERSGLAGRLSPELAAALRVAPARHPRTPPGHPRPPAGHPPTPAGHPPTPAGHPPTPADHPPTPADHPRTPADHPRAPPRRRRAGDSSQLPDSVGDSHALIPDLSRKLARYVGNVVNKSGICSGRATGRVRAQGSRRAVVGMLTGCVQQVFFPEVNAATARVLAAEGCEVIIPPGQGCCGALPLHGGRLTEAKRFARRTIEVFERAGVDAIIVNAAGCGSAMKDYAELLAADAAWADRAAGLAGKVRDFSEFLAELGPAAARHPLPVTAAYHDACHLAHAQRITTQPRELLLGVPELHLAEIADGGICCGSAGIYNLVQPDAARELGERKARTVEATGAGLLVSANPGCAMQISAALAARGTPMPMAHIAEVLDASIRGTPVSTLLAVPGRSAGR